MREKHTIDRGKWRKWSRGLLYHNSMYWASTHGLAIKAIPAAAEPLDLPTAPFWIYLCTLHTQLSICTVCMTSPAFISCAKEDKSLGFQHSQCINVPKVIVTIMKWRSELLNQRALSSLPSLLQDLLLHMLRCWLLCRHQCWASPGDQIVGTTWG